MLIWAVREKTICPAEPAPGVRVLEGPAMWPAHAGPAWTRGVAGSPVTLSVCEIGVRPPTGCLPGAQKAFTFVKPFLAPEEIEKAREELQVTGCGGLAPELCPLALELCCVFLSFTNLSFPTQPCSSVHEWA